jgi:hypothetical protein
MPPSEAVPDAMLPSPFISSDVAPERAFATDTKCEVVVVIDVPTVMVGVVESIDTAEMTCPRRARLRAVVPMSTTIETSSQPFTSAS